MFVIKFQMFTKIKQIKIIRQLIISFHKWDGNIGITFNDIMLPCDVQVPMYKSPN